MATRILPRRLTQGKGAKGPRQKKSRAQSRLRQKRLTRGRSATAPPAAALRKARKHRGIVPPPDGVNARNGQIAFPDQSQDLPDARHAPEERELKRKRAQLTVIESELARQQRVLNRLQAELGPIEDRYFRKVGVRCVQLDEVEARIAETYAGMHPEDMAARQAACRARERANRSRNEILRRSSPEEFQPPHALKRLYRAVARRVHPDLGQSPADREVREQLMAHANRAYQSGDEGRLRAIVSEYEFCPERVRGEGTGAELVRVIRKIARASGRFEEIQKETERVRSSEMYRFKRLAESRAKQGRDVFADAVAAVNARIASALVELRQLEAAAAGCQTRVRHG